LRIRRDTLYNSNDQGQSWAVSLLPGSQSFVVAGNDDEVYVAARGGVDVHKSVDGGNNWQAVLERTPSATNSIQGLHLIARDVVILNSPEFRISLDGGNTFIQASNGLGLAKLSTFYSTPDGRIFGGGDGLYEATVSPITNGVDPNGEVIPNNVVLSQNYPNPFNASTIIQFEMNVDSHLRLGPVNTN